MKNKTSKEAKRETALANLRDAKGPVTSKGRAVVKLNATRHGLRAVAHVLPHLGETRRGWNRHLQSVIESYQPQNYAETFLVERIADVLWRTARVDAYRFAKTNYALKHCDRWAAENAMNGTGIRDVEVLRTFCALPDSRSLDKADAHETHLTKTFIRLSGELRSLQLHNGTRVTATRTVENKKLTNEPMQKGASNSNAVSQTLTATRIQR